MIQPETLPRLAVHQFVRDRHYGQLYAGEPYYERHLLPVLKEVQNLGGDQVAQEGALTHDIWEDDRAALDEVEAVAGSAVMRLVRHLTRTPEETYEQYVSRLLDPHHYLSVDEQWRALTIKLGDLTVNIRECSAPDVAAEYAKRVVEVYQPAWNRIHPAWEELVYRLKTPDAH